MLIYIYIFIIHTHTYIYLLIHCSLLLKVVDDGEPVNPSSNQSAVLRIGSTGVSRSRMS